MIITRYTPLGSYWEARKEVILRNSKAPLIDEIILKSLVMPYLGDIPLCEITTETLESWKRWLLENGHPVSSYFSARGKLKHILTEALNDRKIEADPLSGMKPTHRDLPRLSAWTDEEEIILLQAFGKTRRPILYTLAMTMGMSLFDLAAVTRDALAERPGFVRIDQTLSHSGEIVALREDQQRFLPLSAESKNLFQQAIHLQDKKERKLGPSPQGLIFTTRNNTNCRRSIETDLLNISKETGIKCGSRMMVYNYGIRAVRMGINPRTLMKYMGMISTGTLGRLFTAGPDGANIHTAYGTYFDELAGGRAES